VKVAPLKFLEKYAKGERNMLNIEKTVLPSPEQWEIIIEGMRNPKNSWNKMDSELGYHVTDDCLDAVVNIGEADCKLMTSLAKGGPVHAKYRRMIPVFLTINAPLYWWKEFDTYKVGTVANSCSTMHKIHAKEFTLDDFSHEHLLIENPYDVDDWEYAPSKILWNVIETLNYNRELFLKTEDKKYWWQMIQLLPTSYNQKRTVMLNYEVLVNIYHSRKNHKLDEWHVFCDWIRQLPYSELITGGE
jgi:hypothetical protein